ncbi:MAG: insulinase family protein [Rhodococcus sp. (in: high G+C Gram-positive bacteria)]|nr:insulinase family protein [Rhodococcus sp. (in: high G+C Gram-positive bacteria)]
MSPDLQLEHTLPVIFRGTNFSHHSPIGTEATLSSFQRDNFLNYYRRCYRPDQMIVVAAGDFDATALASVIREKFSSLPKPHRPRPPSGHLVALKSAASAPVFSASSGVGSAETLAAHVHSHWCLGPIPARTSSISGAATSP